MGLAGIFSAVKTFQGFPSILHRQKLLRVVLLAGLTAAFSAPAFLWADWVGTCDYRGIPQLGNQLVTQHYATQAECEQAITGQYYQQGRCNCTEAGSSGTGIAVPSGGNLSAQLGAALGNALADAIKKGNEARDEQAKEEAEEQVKEAQERLKEFEAAKAELLEGLRDDSKDGEDDKHNAGASTDASATDGLGLRDIGSDAPVPQTDKGWAQISLQNNTNEWMNLYVDFKFGCGPVMPNGFCTTQVRPGKHYLTAVPRDKSDIKNAQSVSLTIKKGASPTWTIP